MMTVDFLSASNAGAESVRARSARRSAASSVLARVLADRRIPMAFQPVVALDSLEVVGFEALARPESINDHRRPVTIADLQEVAAIEGTLGELDWLCRVSALTAAGDAHLPTSLTWFVNAEPASLMTGCPADLVEVLSGSARELRVITEVTERGLAADPIGLLRGARAIRSRGDGLAIDDIGPNPASLAVLSLLEPDVLKLDMSLLEHFDDPSVSRICGAVRSYSERSGVPVVAEGIEAPVNARMASVFGAVYAQGFHLGRAGSLPHRLPEPHAPMPNCPDPAAVTDDRTPYEVLVAERPAMRATKELLIPITLHLERQADEHAEPLALLTSFEDPIMFTPRVQARYRAMASRYAFVTTFSRQPTDGTSIAVTRTVDANDPLAREWNVIILGAHYAAALSARSLGDGGPDLARRFDYVLTYDRALVERSARAIAARATEETR